MKSKRIELKQIETFPQFYNTGLTEDAVQAETDKAILVEIPIPTKIWLPKSQVVWLDGTLRMKSWLAKKYQQSE